MRKILAISGLTLVIGAALAVAIFYPADIYWYQGSDGPGSGGPGEFHNCDLNDGMSGMSNCYGEWSKDGDGAAWGVDCIHGEGCDAWMICPGSGQEINVSGDYRCQGDRTGLACKDTITSWWNPIGCD